MRNTKCKAGYSAVEAEKKYRQHRKRCGREILLKNTERLELVRSLFLDRQWSPEEIDRRLKYENYPFQVSYVTIYRGIYTGMLDQDKLSHGNRGVILILRHHGKTRHTKVIRRHAGKSLLVTKSQIVLTKQIQERLLAIGRRTQWPVKPDLPAL